MISHVSPPGGCTIYMGELLLMGNKLRKSFSSPPVYSDTRNQRGRRRVRPMRGEKPGSTANPNPAVELMETS